MPSLVPQEMNYDGLVGQTHSYAGLSFGNVASMRNRGQHARPREAALQGLAKMKALADLGLAQGFIPPQLRPNFATLHAFGYSGRERDVIARVARENPALLAVAYSASAMWVANAATVTPSADSGDGRVHFTPANLTSKLHRAQEVAETAANLRTLFPEGAHFAHHAPVPGNQGMGDEGAANHTRLAPAAGLPGVHVYVYGHRALGGEWEGKRLRFPSRQAFEASAAVARAHGVPVQRTVFLQQSTRAINAGVFHNDVIAVGNDQVLFFHEHAFEKGRRALEDIREAYSRLGYESPLQCVRVPARKVSLVDAVRSYLFNSQLVTLLDGSMALVAPEECREVKSVAAYLDALLEAGTTAIRQVLTLDLRQSMRNGGGPACLRLRVSLTPAERAAVAPGFVINDRSYPELVKWVKRHYRESLAPADLADPNLIEEVRSAMDALRGIVTQS